MNLMRLSILLIFSIAAHFGYCGRIPVSMLALRAQPDLEVMAQGYYLEGDIKTHRNPVKAPLSYLYYGKGYQLHFVAEGRRMYFFGIGEENANLILDVKWETKCGWAAVRPRPRYIDLDKGFGGFKHQLMYDIGWLGEICEIEGTKNKVRETVEELESKYLKIGIYDTSGELVDFKEFQLEIIENGSISGVVAP